MLHAGGVPQSVPPAGQGTAIVRLCITVRSMWEIPVHRDVVHERPLLYRPSVGTPHDVSVSATR